MTPIWVPLTVFFISAQGVCYIRTSSQDSAIIYNSNEDFHVGQAKVRSTAEGTGLVMK